VTTPSNHSDLEFMRIALEEAAAAESRGEVPVGAIIVRDGEVIARAGNHNLTDHDPTGHAEIVALRSAAQKLGNHRLNGCELFVTIEPCAMCAGALVHARLARLVYGATDPKAGAVQSVMQVLNHPSLNHQMAVTGGVLEQECAEVLQTFFRKKRSSSV
jgi:tRNA(adenine34) deaminase